ncbi:DUF4304 domain-containing protein [Nitrospirillum iridis]|uniref:DUF4304 domain-containing protein n=1 Tax=Nitrospirillum iridis TaxID=765888 RepID=A0A7X0AZ15_9PROT|nr:hypothetical protein [Nitrospirillum iridis]MBB6251966.1 hypothetical protein [Nitrospirillum iridis]
MAKSLSFGESVLAMARHKAEAAKGRSQADIAAEKPRDIILAACRDIGQRLAPQGFVFLKSGPLLKRTQGDLTFQIYFQSDRNNIAGGRAALWMHAGVLSRNLAQWKKQHPVPWGSRSPLPGPAAVAGGQIGNLTSPPGWMTWNFADPATRPDVLDDAVASIEKLILPFFALFDDPAGNIGRILDLQSFGLQPLEYAMACLGHEVAEAAGRTYLLGREPAIQNRFRQAYAAFTQGHDLPTTQGEVGRDLAALAFVHNLDLGFRD